MNDIYLKLAVKNGEFYFPFISSEYKLKTFLKNLPEDTNLEMFLSISNSNASYAQLAKIHVMIKEIANLTGHNISEIKKIVKELSGLSFKDYYKSFADCSKTELNQSIQCCIEIGDFLGIQLR